MRYEIYVDGDNNQKGKLLHDSRSSDIKLKVENCILNLEDSKAGSLNFDIDPEHPYYSTIQRVKSYIDFYQDGEEIWSGRVMSEDVDFNRMRILYCEGELAYLNDTCQPQTEYKDAQPSAIMQKLLDVHNQRVDDRRKFWLKANGESFPQITYDVITFTTQYTKTLDAIQNLMEKYKWHVHIEKAVESGVRKRFLVFTEKSTYETNTTQVIEFGKNLVEYTGSFDMSEIATVIIPLGQKISSAGQTLIGDKIEFTETFNDQYFDSNGESHSVDDSGTHKYDETARGYMIGQIQDLPQSMWSTIEKTHYLYFTGRNDKGHAMCFFRNRADSSIHNMKAASNSVVSTESIEEKIAIPILEPGEGVKLDFYCSGFMSGLTMRVNNQKEVDQVFDEFTTVESVNNGSVYVTAQSINLFKPSLVSGDVDRATGEVLVSHERFLNEEPIDIRAGTYTLSCLTRRSSHEVDIFFYEKDSQGNLTFLSNETSNNNTLSHTFTIQNDRTIRIVFKRRDYTPMEADDVFDIQLEESNVAHTYESPLSPLDIYGWFERQVTWDDTTDPQVLYDRAVTYLKSGQFDKMTITIKAYDLTLMGYNVDAIKLGQSIRVTSKPHGLDRFFDVTKIAINVSDWDQTIYTLGYNEDYTLTGSSNQINDTLTSLISGETHDALIAEMKLQAVAQILGGLNGGVTTLLSDDNRQVAHFYSEMPPSTVYWSQFTAADKQLSCLLLDYRGIGFFANGIGDFEHPNSPTITLVNQTGQIVANAIAAGTMLADRIRGGILELTDYQTDQGTRPATIKIACPTNSDTDQWHHNPLLLINKDVEFQLYDGDTSWPNSKGRWIYMQDACIIGGDDWEPQGQGTGWVHSTAGAIWPNFSWGQQSWWKEETRQWVTYVDATGVVISGLAGIGIDAPFVLVRNDGLANIEPQTGQHQSDSGWNVALNNTNLSHVSSISVDYDDILDGNGNTVRVVTDVRVNSGSLRVVNGLICN